MLKNLLYIVFNNRNGQLRRLSIDLEQIYIQNLLSIYMR